MKRTTDKNNRLPVFTNRFRELQGERTNTEFADFLGMSRQTVGFYCNGDRIPDAVVLRQIADKCAVSADWLLGITNLVHKESNEETASSLDLPEKFIQRVQFMRNHEGLFLEKDALKYILESDEFWEAIETIAAAAIGCLRIGQEGIDGEIEDEILSEIRRLEDEVTELTNGVFCVSRACFRLDGLLFRAQQCFNKAVKDYLDNLLANQESYLEEDADKQ